MKPTGIPDLANLTNGLSAYMAVHQKIFNRYSELKEGVPGWSEIAHFVFFRELLKVKPNARILVVGVYHGLDLRYLAGIAQDLGQEIHLTGVDLFEDRPCADWPEELRGKTWEEAQGVLPPNEEAARRNCPSALIVKGDSVDFMSKCAPCSFDIIILDASHDELSLLLEIGAARRILAPGGILCGDDYTWNCPTAGVDKAVQALLPNHLVWRDRIWIAQP